MRALFTTHPAYGHFHPLVPVARALRDAGHDVAVATSDRFTAVVEKAGLRAIAAGLSWLESDDSSLPEELRPSPGMSLDAFFAHKFVAAVAEPLARDLIAAASQWRPDVVVRERTEYGGALAAAALGVPSAAVQVASPSLMTPAFNAAVAVPYNRARVNLGLEPDPGLAALEDQVVLAFGPQSLHDPTVPLPRNFIPVRSASADGTATELPAWAEGLGVDRPLVYATLGTIFNNPDYGLPFFPAVMTGLRDEDVDVLITVGPNVDVASVQSPPRNVRVERYVPQSLLFDRCSAVVCHGGHGTVLAAIENGVPLVVVPFGADQPINARAIERLGIGRVIGREDLSAQRMREAVRAVLHDPEYGRRIRQLRDDNASLPAVAEAISVLERLPAAGSMLRRLPHRS
jgi:UDP:flavonoid glycosyltransferase YjiC (YdhE family)